MLVSWSEERNGGERNERNHRVMGGCIGRRGCSDCCDPGRAHLCGLRPVARSRMVANRRRSHVVVAIVVVVIIDVPWL